MHRRRLAAGVFTSASLVVHRTKSTNALSAGTNDERKPPAPASRTIWEQLTRPPPFESKAPSRFNLETYAGRALHFLDTLGDLSTLTMTGENLREQQKLLARHAAGEVTGATDAELWRARKVISSSVHPETGQEIPVPLRFSAFAPANLIISLGLLRPDATLVSTAFFQWLNQTYNAAVNWQNRASGEAASMEKLAISYFAATGAALAIGVGAMPLLQRLGISGRLVQLTVPATAVSIASVVNLVLTRWSEVTDGIEVYTEDGLALGTSKAAGVLAVGKCAVTRVLWTFCILTAAPVVNASVLRWLPFIAASSSASLALEAGVIFFSIWLSVPLCLAVWPQRDSVVASTLEPVFCHLKHPVTGNSVDLVFFNKGL